MPLSSLHCLGSSFFPTHQLANSHLVLSFFSETLGICYASCVCSARTHVYLFIFADNATFVFCSLFISLLALLLPFLLFFSFFLLLVVCALDPHCDRHPIISSNYGLSLVRARVSHIVIAKSKQQRSFFLALISKLQCALSKLCLLPPVFPRCRS